MDDFGQLKQLAPFMDPHLLLYLLQNNIGHESQGLQEKIKAKMLSADEAKATELDQTAEKKAHKLMTLLSDGNKVSEMRKD